MLGFHIFRLTLKTTAQSKKDKQSFSRSCFSSCSFPPKQRTITRYIKDFTMGALHVFHIKCNDEIDLFHFMNVFFGFWLMLR